MNTRGGDVIGRDQNVHHHYAAGIGSGQPARFHSTIPSLRNRPFVDREDLLKEISTGLGDPSGDAVVILHGQAGVGKSELAQEYARRSRQAYPGGTFLLDGSGPLLATGWRNWAKLCWDSTTHREWTSATKDSERFMAWGPRRRFSSMTTFSQKA
jgi:hypothetical protein